MLQSIRDRLTGILAFFILGILVIPFAFVGVNSYFTSGNDNIVARVNDSEIGYNDFNQSYSNYRRRMQSIMGPAFDPVQFDTLVARREHLDSMIDQELIDQAARNIGLEIDDERLAAEIRRIPAFQVEGEFNADVYQSRLLSQGLTPKQFEAEMRAQSIISQLPTAIMQSSLITRSELQHYVGLQEQTRNFKAVQFPTDLEAVAADIPPEEIEAWYQQYPDRYQSAEQVTVEYVELNAVDLPVGTEPDEEFLRTRFEQQKGRFVSPEQRRAAHILIAVAPNADEAAKETARQTAADLSARVKAGEDFADLARENSDDAGSAVAGGDLGWIEPGLMSELFEEALYALSVENPVSDPVQTGFGWHVIKLEEIQPASGMSYEEARQTLIDEHQAEEAEREFLDRADRLVDIIYEDPTTLESAAMELGLEVQLEGPFNRSGGAGIAANPEVVAAAFSDLVLLQESVSDPVDLGENHMVMVRLREHLPAAVKPLDEVRGDIVLELRQQRAQEAAQAAAQALQSALTEEAATLEELAEAQALEVITVEGSTRRGFNPGPEVVQGVFKLNMNEGDAPVTAIVAASDGYALVVLESVAEGRLAEDALLARRQYERQLANAAASAEAQGLLKQLRANANIEVFETRLQ